MVFFIKIIRKRLKNKFVLFKIIGKKIQNYNQDYYQNNRENLLKQKKEYYLEHKEEIKQYNESYYQENKIEIKEYVREYSKQNKNEIKIYQNKNKEKIKIQQNRRRRIRRITDPQFRIRDCLSSRINSHLQSGGGSKNGNSCLDYLPYTINELKQHLEKQFEPWMNWDNHGRYNALIWDDKNVSTWTWQIDHIIPHSIFHYASMGDKNFRKCWALNNLRPLSAKQNWLDGIHRTRH